MEECVIKQVDLKKQIERLFVNFKKQGQSQLTVDRVTARLELLKEYWDSFKSNHNEMLSLSTKVDISQHQYFLTDTFSSVEDLYLETKSLFLGFVNSSKLSSDSEDCSRTNQTSDPRPTSSAFVHQLPRISLPKFTGNYSEWNNFQDLFTSIILKNAQLSNVEKFHYLKTSLSGEPQQLLKNIPVTGDNFTHAWDILTDRYQNTRLLVNSQLSSLFSIKSATKESSFELKRIYNKVVEIVGALTSLGCPTEFWDMILVYHIVQRLDYTSRKDWETSPSTSEVSTFEDLKSFIQTRIRALEAIESTSKSDNKTYTNKPGINHNKNSSPVHSFVTNKTNHNKIFSFSCSFCKQNHFIAFCDDFKSKSVEDRLEFVKLNHLCMNCLGSHHAQSCQSKKTCHKCQQRHHTFLHQTDSESTKKTESNNLNQPQPAFSHLALNRYSVLLATASVVVFSHHGDRHIVRALIDQGSQVSFISESLAQTLNLKRRSSHIPIIGIGASPSTTSRGVVHLKFTSRYNHNNKLHTVPAHVLPRLTTYVPDHNIIQYSGERWPELQQLQLADSHFSSSDNIDIIFGADIYSRIIQQGLIKTADGCLVAQQTTLGWILSGTISNNLNENQSKHGITTLQCSVDQQLLTSVQRFWEQEEVDKVFKNQYSASDIECENHFRETHFRQPDGRYVVRLPFKQNPDELGDSRSYAIYMLHRMEERFHKDPNLKTLYSKFLEEYIDLGHMELMSTQNNQNSSFYLPHHGVFKSNSSTSKLRVVFNGSKESSTGVSLNDILHVGPQLLPHLSDVLLRWRRHKFVFSTDIEKMYRQIQIHENDQQFQLIVWRKSESDSVQTYKLKTVTYGLGCSPYLAIRTLHQLADDECTNYPVASPVLKQDTYVDDILSGADTLEQASVLQQQLIDLLRAGGFPLRKWTSNDRRLLEHLPDELREQSSQLSWLPSDTFTMLGLTWQSTSDCFMFSIQLPQLTHPLTKRSVLSKIAQLFDPLGYCSPVIIRAKIFMQSLWLLSLGWDDRLPSKEEWYWSQLYNELSNLSNVQMPRWLGLSSNLSTCELHGFCDASQQAYGCVVYLKTSSIETESKIVLVSAKTKLSPLKQISLPRLELCAAVLVTRLMSRIIKVLQLDSIPIYLWSDSTITLSWIQGHPTRWKVYVANRVSEIQQTLPSAQWLHVSSEDNPADCASRGLSVSQLINHKLWWFGPSWLRTSSSLWPSSHIELETNLPEQRTVIVSNVAAQNYDESHDLINKYSEFYRLVKVTAWCLRFISRLRGNKNQKTDKEQQVLLTTEELNEAILRLISIVQHREFSNEISSLRKKTPLLKSSSLVRLNPILDVGGCLRVGGRLKHSLLSPTQKHPLILPSKSYLIWLIIKDAHCRTLHGGVQLTLSYIRQRYWIIHGRRCVKSVIYQCITCKRYRGTTLYQQMGNLPKERITPSRPFFHSGIDYAGPLVLKTHKGRGSKTYKGYIAIFVCLSTKAIHLEAVTDYTSDSFLAAFYRFTSRRGVCSTITSDRGTNFIGAAKELSQLKQLALEQYKDIRENLIKQGVTWKFLPAGAPHMGGIWEAGVKSVKFHLKRIMGDSIYTYEELVTLLTQIESCLNSRPLQALTDDPDDMQALTPAHFLIGEPLLTIPEPSLEHEKISRLSRWQLIQHQRNSFWKLWSNNYLHELQSRSKWLMEQPSVQVHDLVLIKQENLPANKWCLARVTKIHPGDDGLVRVVTLKTATSASLQRPVTKLIPLLQATSSNE